MNNINKKYILIIGGFLLVAALAIVLISGREKNTKKAAIDVAPTIAPTTSFSVISTTPGNNAKDIFPGEIRISFTSDVPINYTTDYSFYLSPQPDIAPKLTSSFPTRTVTYQVLGGLKQNTEYTVVVSNRRKESVAIWSFKTSNEQPESSSGQAAEEQKELVTNYYPLFDYVPFENEHFKIDYTGRLALIVTLKGENSEEARGVVENWIKSKGVNPSTHSINYQNNP